MSSTSRAFEVVGRCAACGCPIYGPRYIFQGEVPQVVKTCLCGYCTLPPNSSPVQWDQWSDPNHPEPMEAV